MSRDTFTMSVGVAFAIAFTTAVVSGVAYDSWGLGFARGVFTYLGIAWVITSIDKWMKESKEHKALEKYRRKFTEHNK